jgi:hypothetical protein
VAQVPRADNNHMSKFKLRLDMTMDADVIDSNVLEQNDYSVSDTQLSSRSNFKFGHRDAFTADAIVHD